MKLLIVKNIIMTNPELDTIIQKKDQVPKQHSNKDIQKVMHKQSRGVGRLQGHSSTKKIHISESTTEIGFLHYKRKEMDQYPSEMMIQPKSLEKTQPELGTRIQRQKMFY
jgi:hypothetical protein